MGAGRHVEVDPTLTLSRGRLLRVACWLDVVVRIVLVVGLLSTLLALVDYYAWETWYVVELAGFVTIWAIYVALTLALRCPGCQSRFLLESWRPKHPSARKLPDFDYHGSAVRDVICDRRITCMYCGRAWRVR